ncbi:hypothetical protein MP638_006852 [Amoeboaphelidium occidentale]|nr:hypothetical protein MP638_006852 [Amoeboaphelidium occidentale]
MNLKTTLAGLFVLSLSILIERVSMGATPSKMVPKFPDVAFMDTIQENIESFKPIFPNGCAQNWLNKRLYGKDAKLPSPYEDYSDRRHLRHYVDKWVELIKRVGKGHLFPEGGSFDKIKEEVARQCYAYTLASATLMVESPRYRVLVDAVKETNNDGANFFIRMWRTLRSWFKSEDVASSDYFNAYRVMAGMQILDDHKVELSECYGDFQFLSFLRAVLSYIYTPECALLGPATAVTVGKGIVEMIKEGATSEYYKFYHFFADLFTFKIRRKGPEEEYLRQILQAGDSPEDLKSTMLGSRVSLMTSLAKYLVFTKENAVSLGATMYFNSMEWFSFNMFFGRTKIYDPAANPFWSVLSIFGEALFDGYSIQVMRFSNEWDYAVYRLMASGDHYYDNKKGDEICYNWMLDQQRILIKESSAKTRKVINAELFRHHYPTSWGPYQSFGNPSIHFDVLKSEIDAVLNSVNGATVKAKGVRGFRESLGKNDRESHFTS